MRAPHRPKALIRAVQNLGLPNLQNTPSALKPYIAPKNIALFEKYGVFTASELHSRYEVFEEEYSKKVHIETAVALNMSKTIIMPACLKYLSRLAETSKAIADVKWGKNSEIESKGKLISSLIEDLGKANNELEKLVVENSDSRSKLAMLGDMRTIVDKLELEIDDDLWPLPKYSEMLFVY